MTLNQLLYYLATTMSESTLPIEIDSACGHIGPFWWINQDDEPVRLFDDEKVYIRKGSWGFGRRIKAVYKPLI